MNEAIVTKYRGATHTRGARVTATACGGLLVSIPYPHELTGEDAHKAAAAALMAKAGWKGKLVAGLMPNGGYVFILTRTD
jgi:hypothetical protein